MNKKNRWLSAMMAVAVSLSILPGTVFAGKEENFTQAGRTNAESSAPLDKNIAAAAIELPEEGTYEPNTLLVKMTDGVSLMSVDETANQYVANWAYLFSIDNDAKVSLSSNNLEDTETESGSWYCVTLRDSADYLDAWQALADEENMLTVQPNYLYTLNDPVEDTESSEEDSIGLAAATDAQTVTEEDPYRLAQTWLDQIDAESAWDAGYTGKNVVVAVVDSGVDMDHPDLKDNLLTGYDFVNEDEYPNDENGHGTHVAGIIAAENNSIGVRGVAYDAKILPVRVMDANGSGYDSDIIAGIKYAVDNGSNIINLSIGGVGKDDAYTEAVQEAITAGVLVVAAAGNEALPTSLKEGETYGGVYVTPANIPGVLTVMATKSDDTLAYFSNYDTDPGTGAEYEIAAPGYQILSTYMGGSYGYMSGTSMACPVTAGAAAVLMGMGCNAETTFHIISSCAEKPSGYEGFSYPCLDLVYCVQKAKDENNKMTAPAIATNGDVTAVLANQTAGHGTVDFSGLNTTSRLYFSANRMVSTLAVSFENIGGSGSVQITGTVGGCKVNQSVYAEFGKTVTVNLSFSGTPKVSNGEVAIALYANGDALYSGSFSAYRLKYLSDSGMFTYQKQTVDGTSAWVATLNQTATLSGNANIGTVWVVDAYACVPDNKTLTIAWQDGQESVLVYCAENCSLQATSASASIEFDNVSLLGYGCFNAIGCSSHSNLELYGCAVYSPYISGILYAGQNDYYYNGNTSYYLQGNAIYMSGFYNCDSLQVNCNYFWGNLVDTCAGASVTAAEGIYSNTFVENDSFESNKTIYPTCSVPNYTGEANHGFYDNCVIGPMKVTRYGYNSLASIGTCYHQSVYGENQAGFTLPGAYKDQISCANSSSVINDDVESLQSSGLNLRCPAFITSMETINMDLANYGEAVHYCVQFNFSAPVVLPTWTEFFSISDPMTGTATVPNTWNDDKQDYDTCTSCTVSGTTFNNGTGSKQYYSLAEFYAPTITVDGTKYQYGWWMAMGNQSLYRWPSCYDDFFYNSYLDTVSAEQSGGNIIVSWRDDRLDGSYKATITRSINGGTATTLATGLTGTSYTDTQEYDADTIVTYSVRLTKSGAHTYSGSAACLIPKSETDMGVALTAKFADDGSEVLTVCLKGKEKVEGSLEFFFPDLEATAITFSDTVKNLGIPYGASCTEKGTTVYLGSGSSDYLEENRTLFTLTANAKTAVQTVEVTDGSEAQNWGASDLLAVDTTQETANCLHCDKVLLATYNSDGHQLSIEELIGSRVLEPANGQRISVFFLDASNNPLQEKMKVQ